MPWGYGYTSSSGASSPNTQQYVGRQNEGAGLYFYRARYYSTKWGRFISEDPIGWRSGQANNYAYVWGNPISFRDPFGLEGEPGLPDPAGPLTVDTATGIEYHEAIDESADVDTSFDDGYPPMELWEEANMDRCTAEGSALKAWLDKNWAKYDVKKDQAEKYTNKYHKEIGQPTGGPTE